MDNVISRHYSSRSQSNAERNDVNRLGKNGSSVRCITQKINTLFFSLVHYSIQEKKTKFESLCSCTEDVDQIISAIVTCSVQ